MILQPPGHIGEAGLRVDVVELGSLDQRVDGGGAATALIGSCAAPAQPTLRSNNLRGAPGLPTLRPERVCGVRCPDLPRVL
jgi:hypothetical protein